MQKGHDILNACKLRRIQKEGKIMSHTSIIKQLCGIFDNNIDITIPKSMHLLPLEKYHEINHFVLHGVLTYKPKACMHCGVKNTGNQDIIKHGFKPAIIRLPNTATNPVLLKLQKQRFYCKHCAQTFIAETPLVEKFCCISKAIKSQISSELVDTQSMRLIAKRYHVSSPTVARTLMKASKGLSPKGNYLPNHLGVDEFKSTSRVANAMSAVLVDTHNRRLIDIIVDRKQASLIDYFSSFTWAARSSVKTVSIDLYTPYLEVIRTCFPNAKIVIDRFHIVKLLNETINSNRIKVMNTIKTSRPSDYKKLKKQWKLLLKNAEDLNFTDTHYIRQFGEAISEQRIVDYLLSISHELLVTYTLMNELKYAISTHDINIFNEILQGTKHRTLPSRTRRTIRTLVKFLPYIHNALKYTVSNGPTEGINNKIKLIKRTGFGYSNFHHLRARILVQFKLNYKPSNPEPYTFDGMAS